MKQCLAFNECDRYAKLTARGTPVLHIEYAGALDDVCAASPQGFCTVRAARSLDRRPLVC